VLSVLDIFKVGLGPSSSHTMGPMNAACAFATGLAGQGLLEGTARVGVQLYGSLALTGLGHCTDRAVLLGLEGHRPDEVDPGAIEPAARSATAAKAVPTATPVQVPRQRRSAAAVASTRTHGRSTLSAASDVAHANGTIATRRGQAAD